MTIFNIITLFGGLSLFLYGMRIMGDGLKQGSAGALKNILEKVTNSPFKSFLLGLVATGIIQSSTATIVLTSGLVGAGIISLHQSVGIIFGANVGTTVTGQIIRLLDIDASGTSILNFFKPETLAPLAAIIGILFIMFLNKRKNADIIGIVAMGFGILFTGLLSMSAAVAPLSESKEFANVFLQFSKTPILGFAVGAGVAFILQSSSATIGILQTLSMTGVLTFSSVFPIIIGIYLGDCVTTAIVCSIGSKADAKRTGVIHILFNITEGVFISIVMFILHRTGALDSIWNMTMTSGSIANTHTIFNLGCAVLFLPMAGFYENLSRKIVKDDEVIGDSIEHELSLLDEKLFTSPALALNAANTAISKMMELAGAGVLKAMRLLDGYDEKEALIIRENEDRIDTLADNVDNYLVKLAPHVPAGYMTNELNYYMQCFGEFERIGDYAMNLMEEAEEMKKSDVAFSSIAQKELEITEKILEEQLNYTYYAYTNKEYDKARHIEPLEEVMDDIVATLRNNHIARLRQGECTVIAGLSFHDILTHVERISDQCSNVGLYTLALKDRRVMLNHHEYVKDLHRGEDPFFNKEYSASKIKYFSMLDEAEE